MALSTATPYGLRDVKLTPYTDAAGTILGTPLDLDIARTLSFSDSEDFEELRGDDTLKASHGQGAGVDWDLESGGLPLEAFALMGGGIVTSTGTGPTEKKVYAKLATDQRPYFKIEGQAISDSGGDLHVELWRCKATGELSGEFSDGAFFLTSASGIVIAPPSGTNANKLYTFTQNAAATAIAVV